MSVIEDSRQILQDFMAPELRAISARLDALEKRIDGVDKRFDTTDRKIDEVDRRAEKRHDEVMGAMRQLVDYNSIQQRLARLESKDSQHQ